MIVKQRASHRGTLLICVLVCLLVVVTIVGTAVQSTLRLRREVRLQHQMRQTELLLDAGVLRAAQRLRESADYAGETWQPTNPMGTFNFPTVRINLNVSNRGNDRRDVVVVASLGLSDMDEAHGAGRTQRSHSFSFSISNASNAE